MIAIKRFNNKDYKFYFYSIDYVDFDLKLVEKEDEFWEEVLRLMLDSAKRNTLRLEPTGWPNDGSPLLHLTNEIVVLPKGICTQEQLEIWLDLMGV